MADISLYRLGKQRTEELLATLTEDDLAATCQACPAWSIRDVVAHHVHALEAFAGDEVPNEIYVALDGADAERESAGRSRDDWTQAGVDAARGVPLDDVLARWTGIVDTMGANGANALVDLTMHLADIHESLGTGLRPDQELVDDALDTYAYFFLFRRFSKEGLPPLLLVCSDTGREIGKAGGTVVSGASYDLLRVIGGRRTRAEADAALQWEPSPRARELFSLYGWPG